MDNSELKSCIEGNLLAAKQGNLTLAAVLAFAESLQGAGMTHEAVALYETWLAHTDDANKVLAMFNFASILQSTERVAEAEKIYRSCLVERPFFGQPCINLGLILERRGEREQAIAVWNKLLSPAAKAHVPSDMQVIAWNHVGRVREELKQYPLAELALANSLTLNPAQPGVIQHWVHIRQKSCDWSEQQCLPGITANQMMMATSPLAMLALSQEPVQQLLSAHAFVARTYGLKEERLCEGRVYNHDRIRIGYVSGDLCVHAVGLLLAELLEGHDRTRYEIYAYDFSPEDGTTHRQRLRQAVDHMRYVHKLTDRETAEIIVYDEIDVLVDLHGLSANAKPGIFALHPAPLQGTYLGFIGTTGMPWFDFVITDERAFPTELEPYFTEKPLRLKSSFIPLTQEEDKELTISRSQFGISDDAFVMAAFGNSYKLNSEWFTVWLSLLHDLPHAVLWLIDDNAAATSNLKAFAQQQGAPTDRIVFTPRAQYDEYKQRLKLADVFLDTFPYNCGSTTNNVIQAGLPMVSMYGKTMVSRMGLSILGSLGLDDFCVDNAEDYKSRVRDIANAKAQNRLVCRERFKQARPAGTLTQELEALAFQLYQAYKSKLA